MSDTTYQDTTSQQEDAAIDEIALSILDDLLSERPTYAYDLESAGKYARQLTALVSARKNSLEAAKRVLKSIKTQPGSELAILLRKRDEKKARVEFVKDDPALVPPLPDGVRLKPEDSKGACLWHDEYVKFSRYWSPRSFENFHHACGWSALSNIAKRRVKLDLGAPRYTPLLIASIADSSIWVKSEAAKVYITLHEKAGLSWMLGADSMTPQALVGYMADISIPDNIAGLSEETLEALRREIAFKGQYGWFYEEFGQQMDSMMQKGGGPYAEFTGIIRRMDDCYPTFKRLTVKHRHQVVENPYLSLLGCMTPSDLRPYAGINSPLWKNGLLARFAFIVPEEQNRNRGRFPNGSMLDAIPTDLTKPLTDWHDRLGQRAVNFKENEGSFELELGAFPEENCTITGGVLDAFYNYNNALLDIVENGCLEQFRGNYARFHMMALRVAMLCASLENRGKIEFRHWAKGQEFAEKARQGLHSLWAYLNENSYAQEQRRVEDEILQYIAQSPTWLTSRLMRKNKFKSYTADKFDPMLRSLVESEELVSKKVGAGWFYTVPGHEDIKPLPGREKAETEREAA